VESHPRDDDEAYAKTVSWISAATWMGLKREFYSAAGELYKVLTIDEYEKIDGYWIITDMTMKDLSRDHSTRIAMDNVEFDIGLSDSFFSERRMKRGPRR
jgi:outer membrane lipoprotein-sorting protein